MNSEYGRRITYHSAPPGNGWGDLFRQQTVDRHTRPKGLELFRFAARQTAVALEVSALQTELRTERDRFRTLLEVTNAVAAHLDLRGLFRAISASLRPLVPAEYLSLALYDPSDKRLGLARA